MTAAERLNAAVDIAADLFRRNGFDGVSIAAVVAATGLNRYALYRTFGGKKALLLAVLARHHETMMGALNAQLAQRRTPVMDALRAYFLAPFAETVPGCDAPGALLCHAAFDAGAKDADIRAFVLRCLAEKRAALEAALARAAAEGDLRADISPAAGADVLINTMFGLGAQAYAGVGFDRLTACLGAVFASLQASAERPERALAARASQT